MSSGLCYPIKQAEQCQTHKGNQINGFLQCCPLYREDKGFVEADVSESIIIFSPVRII